MDNESPALPLAGIEKASILLIALGAGNASGVLQHLTPDEVQKLAAQIAKHEHIDQSVQESVLDEFASAHGTSTTVGGLEYAREILVQALGAEKASELLSDITLGFTGRPFDWLRSATVTRIVNALRTERPQVIALVLAHLTADQAAAVMSGLPDGIEGEVAYRLTAMRPVAPEMVRAVDSVLKERIARDGKGDLKAVGGIHSLVTILNSADRPTENKILSYLDRVEAKIAESVREMLFVFEDVAQLDDRVIQRIIRELDQDDLRMALKGAEDDVKHLFIKNMSERAADSLRDDLDMMGPVKRREVEAAQRRIVAVIRRLEELGEISIRVDDEDVIE